MQEEEIRQVDKVSGVFGSLFVGSGFLVKIPEVAVEAQNFVIREKEERVFSEG